MSQTLGQALQAWQDVLDSLRRKSVSWRGNPLTDRDLHTFTESVVLCALHLTDMSSRFSGIGTHRELVAWSHCMCSLDVSDIGSFLSDVVTALRHVSQPTTLREFKRPLSTRYPFTGMMCLPVKGALESFLQNPSADLLYPCYQFFSFLTHVSLQDLNLDLEGEYEEMEQYLQTLRYPPTYVHEMNMIMREWLADFQISEANFAPQHGPGGTYETARSQMSLEKYRFLGTDPLIDYVFSKFGGLDVKSYYPLIATQQILAVKPVSMARWDRVSQLIFVPKSMKTRRSISKEPATLQYLQQGVFKALDSYFESSALRRHISLHDQGRNASLALESSASQKYSTIDLSSASDTVTLSLVKKVFRGTPLYPFLVALRSETVLLPSGKELRVAKYAPMGSALCFPVETLIFACAMELVVRRAFREGLGFHPDFRVYGDDIIVPSALYEDALRVLNSLGFIANESKSFGPGDRFRESCGMEGYDGVDITPMRLSRGFASSPKRWLSSHAALFTGLVDLANSCYIYDFRLTRAWIVRVLLSDSALPPLFSEDGCGSVYSPCPDNYRAQWRFQTAYKKGPWYQREEIQVRRAVSRPRKGRSAVIDDRIRLYEWLRLASSRTGDTVSCEDPIVVPSSPSVSLLSSVWVNSPDARLTVEAQKSLCLDNQGGRLAPTQ